MKIITEEIGFLGENSYIYYDETAKKAAVIDPGGNADKIIGMIKDEGLELLFILLTHGHYDHTGGAGDIKERTGAKILAHEDEESVLTNPRFSLASFGPVQADKYVKDGEIIEIGGLKLEVIHTPGHTAGSCCYYDRDNGVLFSGDTLFKESVGRHDLPTGDGAALINAIRTKLLTLPGDTRVLSGHMKETTIAHEKERNPFVR